MSVRVEDGDEGAESWAGDWGDGERREGDWGDGGVGGVGGVGEDDGDSEINPRKHRAKTQPKTTVADQHHQLSKVYQ